MDQRLLIKTFAELADTSVDDFDVGEFLQLLVDQCVNLLGVSAASVSLIDSSGRTEATAASSQTVRLLDLFMPHNEGGPGRGCLTTGSVVECPDLDASMNPWPVFARAAVSRGFRAVHALPLRLRSKGLGTVVLFNAEPGNLDSATTEVAQAMADIAVIRLAQERSARELDDMNRKFQTALEIER